MIGSASSDGVSAVVTGASVAMTHVLVTWDRPMSSRAQGPCVRAAACERTACQRGEFHAVEGASRPTLRVLGQVTVRPEGLSFEGGFWEVFIHRDTDFCRVPPGNSERLCHPRQRESGGETVAHCVTCWDPHDTPVFGRCHSHRVDRDLTQRK